MQRLSQALIAGPSDIIGALKDNMMRIGSVCELRFHFVGLELQNDGSLSQCGIAPNDTLDVTLAPSREMQIFVKTLPGHTFNIELSSSVSIDLLKIKIRLATGVPPSEMRH